jgi:ATP-dependent exoDNAse (exonuclease V) alpha subunit
VAQPSARADGRGRDDRAQTNDRVIASDPIIETQPRWTYRVGDKALQTENDYGKNVFNGNLGIVTKVDIDDSELFVDYDGRVMA